MNCRIAFAALFVGIAVGAAAPELSADQERRAQALMRELACPVCEGQPIAESDALVAVEMRREVREAVATGASDATVRARMAENYGETVLLRPRLSGAGWAVWLAPAIILVFGGALLVRAVLGSQTSTKE